MRAERCVIKRCPSRRQRRRREIYCHLTTRSLIVSYIKCQFPPSEGAKPYVLIHTQRWTLRFEGNVYFSVASKPIRKIPVFLSCSSSYHIHNFSRCFDLSSTLFRNSREISQCCCFHSKTFSFSWSRQWCEISCKLSLSCSSSRAWWDSFFSLSKQCKELFFSWI